MAIESEILYCGSTIVGRMNPLQTLLKTDPTQVDSLAIDQIVSLCGGGKLTDNSPCSHQLREYLRIAKSENLFRYMQACVDRDEAFVLPYPWIHDRLELLHQTEREGSRHWHIVLYPTGNGGLVLSLKNGQRESLEGFKLILGEAARNIPISVAATK